MTPPDCSPGSAPSGTAAGRTYEASDDLPFPLTIRDCGRAVGSHRVAPENDRRALSAAPEMSGPETEP